MIFLKKATFPFVLAGALVCITYAITDLKSSSNALVIFLCLILGFSLSIYIGPLKKFKHGEENKKLKTFILLNSLIIFPLIVLLKNEYKDYILLIAGIYLSSVAVITMTTKSFHQDL